MNTNDTDSRFDRIVREVQSNYSIRYVGDRWRVYRGTVAILSYVNGAEALAAMRELQQPAIGMIREIEVDR